MDKYEAEDERPEIKKESFFSKINPFRKKEEPIFDENEEDPFFQALHNSFQGKDDDRENSFPTFDDNPRLSEPDFSLEKNSAQATYSAPSFGNLQNTLNSIRAGNAANAENASFQEQYEPQISSPVNNTTSIAEQKTESSLGVKTTISETMQTKDSEEDEENLVYPFGGWTDENNYGN